MGKKRNPSCSFVHLVLFSGIFLLCPGFLLAQNQEIGLVLSLGTHEQKVGLRVHFSGVYGQVQGHIKGQLCYTIKHLGTTGFGWEAQLAIGGLFAWGEAGSESPNPYLFLLSNQTDHSWSIGYAYLAYWDQQATSQYSGMLSVGKGPFTLRIENDFMAWQNLDRYRTGAMSVDYWNKEALISLRSLIWTGDPYDKANPIRYHTNFPARGGYLDLFGAPYGNCSVGTLGVRVVRNLPYGQKAFWEVGMDAEQIRNFMQNRMVHDNRLLPINWGDFKNPHVPMLDTHGNSFLYLSGQSIRPARLFMQFGLNQPDLY